MVEQAFALLSQLTNEGDSSIYFLKNNTPPTLAFMLPPLEYQGKEVLTVPVDSEYQGQPGKQYLVRFGILVKDNVTQQINLNLTRFVGIPLPMSAIKQIVEGKSTGYSLGTQNCHGVVITKVGKTNISFNPKEISIGEDVWRKGISSPTWEELIEEYHRRRNFTKEGETSLDAKSDLDSLFA